MQEGLEFSAFRTVFLREAKKAPPANGVLRELDYQQPNVPGVHDAMVWITLKKWLPGLLGPGVPPIPADDHEAIIDPATSKGRRLTATTPHHAPENSPGMVCFGGALRVGRGLAAGAVRRADSR